MSGQPAMDYSDTAITQMELRLCYSAETRAVIGFAQVTQVFGDQNSYGDTMPAHQRNYCPFSLLLLFYIYLSN